MCSIFGVFDIKTDAVELRKKALELSRLMRHRGPDWSGIYASDNAILAHERLSIVDVNAGAQPLYNQQKTHVLAVNGEIYNHQALRAEYGDRYQFQTGSDCEVILALYQEKGPEFRRLAGHVCLCPVRQRKRCISDWSRPSGDHPTVYGL